jgi:hypothetical protein
MEVKSDKLEWINVSDIQASDIQEPTEDVESGSEIFFEAACLNHLHKSEYQIILGKNVVTWAKSVGQDRIPAIVKKIDREKASLLSHNLKKYQQLGSPAREMTIIGEMSDELGKQELKQVFPDELVDLHYRYQGEKVDIDEPDNKGDGNPIKKNHGEEEVPPSEIQWDNKKQKKEVEIARKATEGSTVAEKIHRWAITYLSEKTGYQNPEDFLEGELDVQEGEEKED